MAQQTVLAPAILERVQCDTGLTPHQQRDRATITRLWAWHVLWLMQTTGCRVADALRAIEDAEWSAEQSSFIRIPPPDP
jgi:hypothetical protein